LMQPVYSLNFINDIFEKSPEMQDEYYHHYKIVNIKNTEKQIKGLEFVFIELPKFKPQNRSEKKLHELWLRFLTEIDESTREAPQELLENSDTREAPQELLENSDTREAISYMEIGAYTKGQLFTYDKIKDAIMTECSALSDAMREGEEKERRRMILSIYQAGLPVETISVITGLTPEEITKIMEE